MPEVILNEVFYDPVLCAQEIWDIFKGCFSCHYGGEPEIFNTTDGLCLAWRYSAQVEVWIHAFSRKIDWCYLSKSGKIENGFVTSKEDLISLFLKFREDLEEIKNS